MRVLLLSTMLALLTFAPFAAAQEETNKTECLPDAMCAYGEPDCIDCTRGPADGSCENCRGEDAGDTCMDGTDAGEICDRDVQYLGGPSDGGSEPINTPAVEPVNSVPGASFALVVAAFALAIFLLARRS